MAGVKKMLGWLKAKLHDWLGPNYPGLEDMPADMADWPSDVLLARLIEAAMTAGLYIEWGEHQEADRQRYIAAATLLEDCADELEARLDG